jgi:acyl-CoA thioesterase II
MKPMLLRDILTLEPHGGDVFTGRGPAYPWDGLYGGQVMAQALRAACDTVDDDKAPHSLHGYFLRRGTMQEPVRYEVERLRDGRSFSTRRVVAYQGREALASMGASFQVPEASPEAGVSFPPAHGPPDELARKDWGPWVRRHPIPIHDVGRVAAIMQVQEELGEDPVLHACALTFLSDDLPTDASGALHPEGVVPGVGRQVALLQRQHRSRRVVSRAAARRFASRARLRRDAPALRARPHAGLDLRRERRPRGERHPGDPHPRPAPRVTAESAATRPLDTY